MDDIHAVSIVAVDKCRFLLVRRGRAPAKGLYAFPGGRVEPGETHEEAARRELMEETNLRAGELAVLEQIFLDGDGDRRYRLSIFRANDIAGDLRAGDDAEAAGWYTLEEIRALPATESTLAVATRVFEAPTSEMPLAVPGGPGKMSK